MIIGSIGNFTGRGWDGSLTDENHIADALEELGHQVIRHQREIPMQELPSHEYDFFLIQQWDNYDPMLVPDLKVCFGRPVVFAAFDYQAWGQEWCERLIAGSDLYLSKRIADSRYKNWSWWSQDFAPKFLDKYPSVVGKDIDVLFTGSYLPWATERNETLKAVDEKFNLVIHSVNEWPGFKDVRPPIMDDGLPELYARAKVILSIDHTLEAGYWSDRNAQIMCCGGFVLFRYVPMSETVFRNYIDYFYSKEDCLEKVEASLERPQEDLDLECLMSHNYAQQNLKVDNRVHDLLTIVRGIL